MKLVWVNNVSSIIGGTAACTLSMSKAFPEARHIVHAGSGNWTAEAHAIFGSNCTLTGGGNLRELLFSEKPDIVILQNIPITAVPNTFPEGSIICHYLHSSAKGSLAAHERFVHRFSVSRWLAGRTNTSLLNVLYQPVHAPPMTDMQKREGYFVIGRLCTPQPAKWRDADLFPHYNRLAEVSDRLWFDFVGCPPGLKPKLTEACRGRASFYNASYEARKLYRTWDVLLYSGDLEESYGRTVTEAQRAGVIPIVAAKGGFAEQIEDYKTGMLCNCVDSYCDAVRYLLHDPDRKVAMSVKAQQSGDHRGSLSLWREAFLMRLEDRLRNPPSVPDRM